MSGCPNCSNNYSCNVCAPNNNTYKVNNTCTQCPNNCYYCSDNIGCIACIVQHYNNNGSCFKCFSHCYNCSSDNLCLNCFYGYYLADDNSTCIQCTDTNHPNCFIVSLSAGSSSSGSGVGIGMIAGIAAGSAVIVLLFAIILYRKCKRNPYVDEPPQVDSSVVINKSVPPSSWKNGTKDDFNPKETCPICQI
jgi:hypothetical protein